MKIEISGMIHNNRIREAMLAMVLSNAEFGIQISECQKENIFIPHSALHIPHSKGAVE